MSSGRAASAGDALRVRGDRHESCAGAQRRLAREARRARHAGAAADHQHVPVAALVRAARAPRQGVRDDRGVDQIGATPGTSRYVPGARPRSSNTQPPT